jgi:hypothetical protein
MNLCSYTHGIFDKGPQNMMEKKDSSTNVARKTG